MYFVTFLIVLLCLWSSEALVGDLENPLVKLPLGYVRGRNHGDYLSFESIPYAKKNFYQFEPPKPYDTPWNEPFNATQPPEVCLQWDPFIEGEDKVTGTLDCLTVSIYKPMQYLNGNLPVVVDIPGGFFMYGGALNNYPESFMRKGQVIFVKFNYRVGPLGFLSTGDGFIPGNLGLKDQRLALKWIKANIAQFGGNPQQILVMGNDAGGASVHLHLLKEDFNELASAAVSISGNALDPWVIQDSARRRALELGRILGCPQVDDDEVTKLLASELLRNCLEMMDSSKIVRAAQQMQILDNVPLILFGPVIEDITVQEPFITKHPAITIEDGNISTVPWIVSYVTEDGGYFTGPLLRKENDGREELDELNQRWNDLAPLLLYYRDLIRNLEELDDYSRDIRQKYMGNESFSVDSYYQMQRMFTDMLFKDGVEWAVNLHRKQGKAPVYVYRYNGAYGTNPTRLEQMFSQRNDLSLGTIHGDDYLQMFNVDGDENFINMIELFAKERRAHYRDCELKKNSQARHIEITRIIGYRCENIEWNTFEK